MLIPVLLKDGSYEKIFANRLERMLVKGEVMAFKRVDGWVLVGRDQLRGHGGFYHGPDRRDHGHQSVKYHMS